MTEKQVPEKRARALNIRHFVTTDQVGRGNCTIECCPTDDMVGDCMTKGLQGVKFATFRKKILGMWENFASWREQISLNRHNQCDDRSVLETLDSLTFNPNGECKRFHKMLFRKERQSSQQNIRTTNQMQREQSKKDTFRKPTSGTTHKMSSQHQF